MPIFLLLILNIMLDTSTIFAAIFAGPIAKLEDVSYEVWDNFRINMSCCVHECAPPDGTAKYRFLLCAVYAVSNVTCVSFVIFSKPFSSPFKHSRCVMVRQRVRAFASCSRAHANTCANLPYVYFALLRQLAR